MASPIYAPDWINTLYNPPGSYAGGGYSPSSTRNAYSQVGTGFQATAGTLNNPRMDYLNMLYQPNTTREPVETQAPTMPVIQAPGSVTGTTPVQSPVDAIANKYLPPQSPNRIQMYPNEPVLSDEDILKRKPAGWDDQYWITLNRMEQAYPGAIVM